jgi:SAM-dependent methyltransferase
MSAEFYDSWSIDWIDTAGTIDRLADLAGDEGPVLELGIGTGRIAVPLAERGIAIHGVDASEAIVAKLRAKPGGARVPVTIGDFSDIPGDDRYSLIFVVASTFYQLQSQDAQVRCMRSVAQHLRPGGLFVVDAFVLDPTWFAGNHAVRIAGLELDQIEVQFMKLDTVEQRLLCQRAAFSEQGIRLVPIPYRYAWPCELDLMAQLAGLRLRERTGGWRGEAFSAASRRHISTYQLPPGGP